MQYGVTPNFVVGHSSGEITAVYASGTLTLREAIICSYLRGLAMTRAQSTGGMIAVGAGVDKITGILPSGVQVACINSPESVTISGDLKSLDVAVDEIKKTLGRRTLLRKLRVDKAYHSRKSNKLGSGFFFKLIVITITDT